ncbi:Putative AAT family amino acid transporter [[Torrubiella] hemipterigena]|uniref:Putative AAT family amino acid transporter n=1 Tax=[Torrubiella] hemipterigena TaxID=1531966 RepID=A0A0A1TRF4_9HYPO|nr:Putative AAT family amino acid transporter [[Torrubiella] hemipterigena]
MADEKRHDHAKESPKVIEEAGQPHYDIALGEAADLYGDIQTAQELGYVKRGLKSRHIQFIALGGTIGTGLFIGIGSAFTIAGPLSVLLGYTLTGIAIFGMMQCLGEMATWLPLAGAIPQYCARYVDPAMGFAVGWNNWYSSALTLCAEISAACIVIQFWDTEKSINPAVWITILIVLVVCLNIFAVSIYGEAEFCFASIKLITIVGLLILAFIIDVGGVPGQQRLGFHYWKSPYEPMKSVVASGSAGRFLGFFSTLVNAAFSFGGVEMVAVAAGEAENPRKNIPKAVKRVFWRILVFYVLGSLAIGVCVASDDENLLKGTGSAASPWVIAIKRANIQSLPSIINAVILTSASSSANAFLYTGSRYLFALAQNGQAPRVFLKCTNRGVPVWAILFTASFACLTYMTVSSGSATVFGWFQTLTTITSLLTWVSVLIAYLRFKKAMAVQGVSPSELPFKSRFQPYAAWVSLIFFLVIIVFNGWQVFTYGNWDPQAFVTAYICVPVYLVFYVFWKIFKRTSFVKPEEADLFTGKAAIDAEHWPEQHPRNFLERIWFWIA